MTDINDAGPRFQMSLQGIPMQVADGKIRLEPLPTDVEGQKTFAPTHWALPTDSVSQVAICLYGLSQNTQFTPLHEMARELLGLLVTRIKIDPDSMPRIVMPGAPAGMKR